MERAQIVKLIKPLDILKLELKKHVTKVVRKHIRTQSKTFSIVIQMP